MLCSGKEKKPGETVPYHLIFFLLSVLLKDCFLLKPVLCECIKWFAQNYV